MATDLPDWQLEVVIGAGGVNPVLASGNLNLAGGGHQDLAFPVLTGYEQVRLIISQILANGNSAKLQLLIATDNLGGAYNYLITDLLSASTSISGDSTGIDLFIPAPTGTGRTIARGDNALTNQASVDIDFYGVSIVDTGVGQQPPLNFAGRYVAGGSAPDSVQASVFGGYYGGSKWSTATSFRVVETSGLPTTVTGKWGLLGYKYP